MTRDAAHTWRNLLDRIQDRAELARLAESLGIDLGPSAARASPVDLRETIYAALSHSEHWEDAIARLTEPDIRTLLWLLEAGENGIRTGELERERFRSRNGTSGTVPPPNPRASVEKLTRAGFVLPRTGSHLFVPEEALPVLMKWVGRSLLRVRPHDLTVLLPDPPSPADVVESLSRLMAGLRHPVPVTQKGTVYRRALVQLLDLVGPAPVPAGPKWSQTFTPILKHLRHPVSWQGYDDRLAPFLAMLAALGLLVVDPDGRTVKTCEDASAFAAGEPWSLYRVIVHTWLRLLKSFPGTSAVRARALPADTWVPLEALALERPAHSFAEREGLFLLAVTGYHLGALRFAMGPEENVFVQLTEGAAHALLQTDGDPPPGWPAFSRTVHVQSSFEIVTPPYLHPATWFDLLFLTEPVRIDRSSILCLTEASFARHRDHDLSPRDAVEILTRSIRGPVPQAVSFTLSGWAEKMKGVGLSQRLVVRLDDESLAERFRSIMEQGHVAFERVTPTLWLVPPGSHVWVQDRLTAAGMITRDETVSPSESIDSFRVLFEGRAPELPRWFALPWPGPTHPIARQLWTPTPEPTLGNDWGKGDDEPDDF